MMDKFAGRAHEVCAWLTRKAEEKRLQDGTEPVFEAKLRRRKRSLTQNAYYWAMLNDLAAALGMSDDEVHAHMLKSYGACDTFTVRDDVPLASYFRYYDIVGQGWLDGIRYLHIRAFKGSSEMDSREFSRLIDGMRQECEAQGIQVMTPSEIASLRYMGGCG